MKNIQESQVNNLPETGDFKFDMSMENNFEQEEISEPETKVLDSSTGDKKPQDISVKFVIIIIIYIFFIYFLKYFVSFLRK